MTRVTISSNANGTGNVNFAAPNTNSAITVTLPTSNVDMDSIGSAPTTYNQVGAYFLAVHDDSPGSISANGTTAGTKLQGSSTDGDLSGVRPSGTWQCMGFAQTDSSAVRRNTLWVRIS